MATISKAMVSGGLIDHKHGS